MEMRDQLKKFIDRFMGWRSALPALDLLLSSISPKDTLENRLNWLVDLVQWVRRPGDEPAGPRGGHHAWQDGRLRRLMDVLDRQPGWKRNVARTLRSIVRETSALQLLSETGLPRQFGLIHEFIKRISDRVLPTPPDSLQLGVLFDRLFGYREDGTWIRVLEDTTLRRFFALLHFDLAPEEANWNTLPGDLDDAALLLTTQLRVSGCSEPIRSIIKHERIRDLPFFKLSGVLQAALVARDQGDAQSLLDELNCLRRLAAQCGQAVGEVKAHLESRGVSTEVVYQLAFIEAALARLVLLTELAFTPSLPAARYADVLAHLIEQHQARKSVADLVRKNFHLLARKIVERSAKTGEHYFSRTRDEYREMVRRAAGGGALMAFTTWFKSMVLDWHMAGLLQGLAASVNYSAGFVAIQLTGCTLATKQPATTAPALASRMHTLRDPKALEALVDEIATLIRSQTASIFGNLLAVVPIMLMICQARFWLYGGPVYTPEKAGKALQSLSIFGLSPLDAAFTGILLCVSSLVAAWADNWFAYRRIGRSLQADRRLVRIVGVSRAAGLAGFLTRHIAGFAGNISLGFMLGILPELAAFAGIPLEIRHVTLSSAQASAAVFSLGLEVFRTWTFWLAFAGIMSIGFLNVVVSFACAFWIAGRARDLRGPDRQVIYRAVAKRLWRSPLSFLFRPNPPTQEFSNCLPVSP